MSTSQKNNSNDSKRFRPSPIRNGSFLLSKALNAPIKNKPNILTTFTSSLLIKTIFKLGMLNVKNKKNGSTRFNKLFFFPRILIMCPF
ncbi:hypothetical protein MHA01_06480 [Marinococcus halophilus]|uniref:Uncharacterized protein n=1 Tax=Marinococcus halophilus TaxID=1371 RepID=A0A510Y3H4_MARHA|nr:hypothetical protein MHA01_06480 [Marinococcus halophilus]